MCNRPTFCASRTLCAKPFAVALLHKSQVEATFASSVIPDAKVGRAKYYADPMNERAAKERPAIISLLCILGFLGVAFGLLTINSSFNKALGATFQAYYAIVLLISLVAYIAMWKMKKWGAVLYCVLTVVHLGVSLQLFHFKLITMLLAIALNAIFIAVLIYNFSKLD
jgi:hypothetical protein